MTKTLVILTFFTALLCNKIFAQATLRDAYPNDATINLIRMYDALSPTDDPTDLLVRPVRDVRQTSQYYDGLGRPLQTVVKMGSQETGKQAKDLVNAHIYDAFGREELRYLPFASATNDGLFKTDPFQQLATFYDNNNSANPLKGQGETFLYSQTLFETSPLNRAQETFAPGNNWAGTAGEVNEANRRSIKIKHWVNMPDDAVRIWNVTANTGGFSSYSTPAGNAGLYATGDLYKKVTIDEHNNQVIEFKDKTGKLILKKVQSAAVADGGAGSGYPGWLCTYYIYDGFNNLRCVVQPRGVELLEQNNWDILAVNGNILNEQCFQYAYDQRNRMIMKKIPGAKEVYMVYDANDRIVMLQDANMRDANKWLVTLYDGLGKPVQTGLLLNTYSINGIASQTFAQHRAAAKSSSVYPFDVSNTPANNYWEWLTKTGYDNYSNIPAGLSATFLPTWNTYFDATDNSSYPYPQTPVQSMEVKGLVTWTQNKVLGTADQYLGTVTLYDDKKRVIQVQSHNIVNGVDVLTTQYNWQGQPLIIVFKHNKDGDQAQTTVTVKKMHYDDLGRLVKTESKISNTNIAVNGVLGGMPDYKTISIIDYDALGKLKTKNLSPEGGAGGGPLEKLTYDYNIQGWLLGINKNYLSNGQVSAAYFGMELNYDKDGYATTDHKQLNGNVGSIIWRSQGDGEKRKYDFKYDAVNRLLKADFNQQFGSHWDKTDPNNSNYKIDFSAQIGDGNDPTLAYDANGNILRMQQWGLRLNNSPQIDDLTYSYLSEGNRLGKVTDIHSDAATKLGDFKDGSIMAQDDYCYDKNGNLTLDNNKAISGIQYNHLNLPTVINVNGKGTISYTYDASGVKLKKVTVDNTVSPARTTTILYAGGQVYENNVLQFINNEEGRVRFTPANGQAAARFDFDYFIKDHLGNVRMVLTEEKQQHIYPAATLEGETVDQSSAVNEERKYYNIDPDKIVNKEEATGITSYKNKNGGENADDAPVNNNPYSDVTANSEKLYKLKASSVANGGETGLGITIKVMSGDRVDIMGKSYYFENNAGGQKYSVPVEAIVSGIFSAPGGMAGGKGVSAADVNGQSMLTGLINSYLSNPGRDDNDNGTSTKPRAYINWMLFDDNFRYVVGNFERVGTANEVTPHFLSDIQVTKNGYLYVYCSNESPVKVFFDNLQVMHTRGALLEESHYYPFGLTMAGISSKALGFGEPGNNYKYNGIEQENNFDLNMYEAFYRNLDPQVGRFWQIDPVTTHSESPYVFVQNNPISKFDWMGDYFTWANPETEERYKKLRKENGDRIAGYMTELSGLDLNSTDEKVQKQIDELTSLINMHGELNSQWEEMETSPIEFHVSDAIPDMKGAIGTTAFSESDNRININVGKNDKVFGMETMAHELRHGYGYISGERVVGSNSLLDITDEVVAYNAGFLFLDRVVANRVANGYFNVDWFKKNKLKDPLYRHLTGREESINLNTVSAVYQKYFNDDRISKMMQINQGNINYTVKDAINALNEHAHKTGRQPEYRYGGALGNVW